MKRLPKQNDKLAFKQEAIRRVEVEGKRQADVASELGIIEQTLHVWRKAHPRPRLPALTLQWLRRGATGGLLL